MFTCLRDRNEAMALVSFLPNVCTDEPSPQTGYLSATLESARPCPARGEYIELHFQTAEGPWSWCFPTPVRQLKRSPKPIALTLGPYGVTARRVGADGGFGVAVDVSSALPMILAGADVTVARYLVTAGR
jgi:hypothetical protein